MAVRGKKIERGEIQNEHLVGLTDDTEKKQRIIDEKISREKKCDDNDGTDYRCCFSVFCQPPSTQNHFTFLVAFFLPQTHPRVRYGVPRFG